MNARRAPLYASLPCMTLLCMALLSPVDAARAGLQQRDILLAAADPDCLQYRVEGLCFWQHCTPSGCTVRVSPRIRHYLPDAVVTAWSVRPPWEYSGRLNRAADGAGGLSSAGREAGNLRFLHAEVVGSPALAAQQILAPGPWLCPSAARALRPYFLSNADFVGWRFASVDLFTDPAQLVGGRRIGRFSDVWGPLHPRHGFVIQADVRRAAAVIAQRAADISTRGGAGRVHLRLGDACGPGCEGPPPVRENDPAGGRWQMLFPKRGACRVFGDGAGPPASSARQQYAWHLWRPYRCCEPRGQKLLRAISLTEPGP